MSNERAGILQFDAGQANNIPMWACRLLGGDQSLIMDGNHSMDECLHISCV